MPIREEIWWEKPWRPSANQVVIATKFRIAFGPDGKSGLNSSRSISSGRGGSLTAGNRDHRPVLSAPCGPEVPIEECRSVKELIAAARSSTSAS